MYSVSEDFKNNIISDNRAFAIKLTFGSSTVLTGATIQDITLDEMINSGENLTMGCACSNKLTVNLINPPTNIIEDVIDFEVQIRLITSNPNEEWIPLGKFYGAVAETNNDFKNLKLTAYDGFSKMTGKYNATVESETTLQAVYDDLKTQLYEEYGVVLKDRTLPEYEISNFPYLDITYTQAIGYVAGCLGGMARFDRLGELEIVWYEDFGEQIPRAMQYMNGFTRTTEKSLVITTVSTGTKDVPIVRGSGANGTEISFENPYMTDAMADEIYNKVNNLVYTPGKVKWRGNPAVQAGDIVTVIDKNGVDHKVLVMNRSLKVSGGCTDTLECKGTSTTQSAFSNSFESVGQKIDRMYSNLETAILNATNAITGNKGGYVVFHDYSDDNIPADGKPDEILIMDTDDIATATKVWRWNKQGLGYAENQPGLAYKGPYRIAITADGQINADFITTGTLSANHIAVESYDGNGLLTDYIHFGEGSMTFGEEGNEITLKLENDKVAFYIRGNDETPVAYFSNNSFEINNLGLIKFSQLEIIPRPSGNITFNIRK